MRHFVVVLLCAACSDPCAREAKAAFIGLGGPVGLLVSALQQCAEDAPPEPQPVAAVATSGLQAEPPPDMAAPLDLAEPLPDLAQPADLTPPPLPPDLSPITVNLAASDFANWWIAGPIERRSQSFAVTATYDFAQYKPIDATVLIPVTPLPAVQGTQPRQYALTFSADFAAAWGMTSRTCDLPGRAPSFYVKGPGSPGPSYACVLPTVGVQFLVDDQVVYDGGVGDYSLQSHYTRKLPLGQYIPVKPGQRLALRLTLDGDVTISGITVNTSVEESF